MSRKASQIFVKSLWSSCLPRAASFTRNANGPPHPRALGFLWNCCAEVPSEVSKSRLYAVQLSSVAHPRLRAMPPRSCHNLGSTSGVGRSPSSNVVPAGARVAWNHRIAVGLGRSERLLYPRRLKTRSSGETELLCQPISHCPILTWRSSRGISNNLLKEPIESSRDEQSKTLCPIVCSMRIKISLLEY